MTANSRRLVIAAGMWLLLLYGSSAAQTGGNYDLSWNRIASGGTVTAVGGIYAMGGTAGQSEAGVHSGGLYVLEAGFWPGIATFSGTPVEGDSALAAFSGEVFAPRCFPNPSTEGVTIHFGLRQPEYVRLHVFDAGGRVVRVLTEGMLTPGAHSAAWDGTTDGRRAGQGVYFYKLDAGRESANGKFVLMR